jgi:hypothetical protein
MLNILFILSHAFSGSSLEKEFQKAKGFTGDQIFQLEWQRIDCNQRVYTETGMALDGVASLKVTRVNERLHDVQFDTSVNLGPLETRDLFTVAPDITRELFDFSTWKTGEPMRFTRRLNKDTMVYDEFRVLSARPPIMLIVKETVGKPEKMHFYFICQQP